MAAAVPDPIPAGDPIELLLAEHRTILAVFDEVERESRRLEQQGICRGPFWQDLLRFADAFDSGLHHHKEEQLLFPALERSGLSATVGPTAALRDDHRRSHFCRQRIEQALQAGDRVRLAASASTYLDLTRAHLQKEDQILFPLARRLLAPAELAALHRDFLLLPAERNVRHWLRHPYEAATGA